MPSCLLPTNNENGSSYQDHCSTSFGHLLGKLSIFFSFVRPSPGWRTASWIAHALRLSMARTRHIDKNSELRRVNRVRFSKCYNNGKNKINARMKWWLTRSYHVVWTPWSTVSHLCACLFVSMGGRKTRNVFLLAHYFCAGKPRQKQNVSGWCA